MNDNKQDNVNQAMQDAHEGSGQKWDLYNDRELYEYLELRHGPGYAQKVVDDLAKFEGRNKAA